MFSCPLGAQRDRATDTKGNCRSLRRARFQGAASVGGLFHLSGSGTPRPVLNPWWPVLNRDADHTTNERPRVFLRPPIEQGNWSLVRQETNMTNLNNDIRELNIDELDAVNGGKGDGKGDGGGGKGNGPVTGGGDGLGWLRTILRTLL